MIATRPSDDRSNSGTETDSNDKALTAGRSARSESQPVAGPSNEGVLIVPGATTGERIEVSPFQWLKRVKPLKRAKGWARNSGGVRPQHVNKMNVKNVA